MGNPITKTYFFFFKGRPAVKAFFLDGNIQIGYGDTKRIAVKDACEKAKVGFRTESNPHRK
jgi:hypothetical protein